MDAGDRGLWALILVLPAIVIVGGAAAPTKPLWLNRGLTPLVFVVEGPPAPSLDTSSCAMTCCH